MVDPVTLALIGTAVSVGGSVLTGIQGAAAGRAQAKVAKQQAELERRSATTEERNERERARRFRSSQLARFSKAGVLTTGTPSNVLEQTAEAQERDALSIRFGGKVRQSQALSQAALAKQAGSQALIGGFTKAGSTLLGSGAFARKPKTKVVG